MSQADRRNTLIFILLVVVAVLLYQRRDRGGVKSVDPAPTSFEKQRECSLLAEQTFHRNGFSQVGIANFHNHFNGNLQQCFVSIEDTDLSAGYFSMTLLNAAENNQRGFYYKATSTPSPSECYVVSAAGAKHECKSETEYRQLLKSFLED